MRISDWSSDVCSSDPRGFGGQHEYPCPDHGADPQHCQLEGAERSRQRFLFGCRQNGVQRFYPAKYHKNIPLSGGLGRRPLLAAQTNRSAGQRRSEEHTSELQSLMRISYAVFCLKKKNTTRTVQRL